MKQIAAQKQVVAGRQAARAASPKGGAGEPRRRRRRGPDMGATWRAYKLTGDPALRNELIEAYLYIVKMIGNRVAARLPRSIDVQDLRSAGTFGLMRAVENFDIEIGTPFESYCAMRVRGAILDELRAQDWVPRLVRNRAASYLKALTELRRRLDRDPSDLETAEYMGVAVEEAERFRRESNLTSVFTLCQQEDREDDPRALRKLDALMDRDSDLPFERMVAQDLARRMLHVLAKPERTVIALYYDEGLTMKEIGRVMGISESRVCQIHTKTLRKLRKHIERIRERADGVRTDGLPA